MKAADGVEGIYALLDQIQALNFARENIAAFGGDPSNITVFGESAGAINTLVLIASPRAKGLFQKAIVESGFLNELPLSSAETQGASFVNATGCPSTGDVARCLRALSMNQIIQASQKLSSVVLSSAGATIDGVVLKQGVLQTVQSGQAMPIPVLIGTNAEEMRTLLDAVVNLNPVFTESDYKMVLEAQYGQKAALVEVQYPVAKYLTPRIVLEEVLGDQLTQCPTRALTRAFNKFQPQTYRYVFSHVSMNPMLVQYGAGHGLELPYVFGTMSSLVYSAFEFDLSAQMRRYWASFATTGNPNIDAQPLWPTATSDAYLDLNLAPAANANFHGDKKVCRRYGTFTCAREK